MPVCIIQEEEYRRCYRLSTIVRLANTDTATYPIVDTSFVDLPDTFSAESATESNSTIIVDPPAAYSGTPAPSVDSDVAPLDLSFSSVVDAAPVPNSVNPLWVGNGQELVSNSQAVYQGPPAPTVVSQAVYQGPPAPVDVKVEAAMSGNPPSVFAIFSAPVPMSQVTVADVEALWNMPWTVGGVP